jgi:hypothetical protein
MADVIDLPRRPGPPPGTPKTPGSGRKVGSRNRVTKEIAEIAQKHGRSIVFGLVKAFKETDDLDVKVKIAALVLSYGYGQPTRRSEISGPDGGPIQKQTQILEASQRVADVFAAAADSADPAEQLNDESLGAVQAVNFITAAREAQGRIRVKAGPATDALTSPLPAAPEPRTEPIPDPDPVKPVPPRPGCTLAFLETDFRIVALPPDRPNLPPIFALHGSAGMMRRGSWDVVLAEAKKHAGDDLGAFVLQQPKAQSFEPSRVDQMPSVAPPPVFHRPRPR